MIKIDDPKKYFNYIKKIPHQGMEQSEFWYKYKHKSKQFVFYVDSKVNTSIGMMGMKHNKPFVGKILHVQGGPVYNENVPQKKVIKFFTNLKNEYTIIEIDSTHSYDVSFEIAMRKAGFKRPFMYRRCPLTIYIYPNNMKKYDRNWRRNLKKSYTFDLEFYKAINNEENVVIFLNMFNEMSKYKKISYKIHKDELLHLLECQETYTFFIKYNGKIIAGRIIAIHENYAYDLHASNSLTARNTGATYFLLDNIFNFLKMKNISIFDFGRISPGSKSTYGVSIHKEGSNGEPIAYNGEWSWYKKPIYKYILFLYQKYFLKIEGF